MGTERRELRWRTLIYKVKCGEDDGRVDKFGYRLL